MTNAEIQKDLEAVVSMYAFENYDRNLLIQVQGALENRLRFLKESNRISQHSIALMYNTDKSTFVVMVQQGAEQPKQLTLHINNFIR